MARSHCFIVKSCEIQILDQGPSRGARFLPHFSWEETMTSPWLSAYSAWWSNNHLEKYESQLGGTIPYIYIICIYIYTYYGKYNSCYKPPTSMWVYQTSNLLVTNRHDDMVISRNWKAWIQVLQFGQALKAVKSDIKIDDIFLWWLNTRVIHQQN